MTYALMFCLFAGPVFAEPHSVQQTAHALFDRLQDVQVRSDFEEECGLFRPRGGGFRAKGQWSQSIVASGAAL